MVDDNEDDLLYDYDPQSAGIGFASGRPVRRHSPLTVGNLAEQPSTTARSTPYSNISIFWLTRTASFIDMYELSYLIISAKSLEIASCYPYFSHLQAHWNSLLHLLIQAQLLDHPSEIYYKNHHLSVQLHLLAHWN